jgi:hypothetical protein
MRGQHAQGVQGRDNSIEVFQQQGPVFVLLAIITSFFPSSISYMTSGIHGIRGPHGKEWTLADEQELIKLLVTLKCLLPVMRPAKTPTHISEAGGEREVGRSAQT